MVRRSIYDWLWGLGLTRHSLEDIMVFVREDAAALAATLGDNDFFLGADPTPVDAAVFAILDNFLSWEDDLHGARQIFEAHGNLVRYVQRMKATFYPA